MNKAVTLRELKQDMKKGPKAYDPKVWRYFALPPTNTGSIRQKFRHRLPEVHREH